MSAAPSGDGVHVLRVTIERWSPGTPVSIVRRAGPERLLVAVTARPRELLFVDEADVVRLRRRSSNGNPGADPSSDCANGGAMRGAVRMHLNALWELTADADARVLSRLARKLEHLREEARP